MAEHSLAPGKPPKRFMVRFNAGSNPANIPNGMREHLENLLSLVMLAVGEFVFSFLCTAKGTGSRSQKGYGVIEVVQATHQVRLWAQSGSNDSCREFMLAVPKSLHESRQFADFVEQLRNAIATGEPQYTEEQLRELLARLQKRIEEARNLAQERVMDLNKIRSEANDAEGELTLADQEIARLMGLLDAARDERNKARDACNQFENELIPVAQELLRQADEKLAEAKAECDGIGAKLADISRRRVEAAMEAIQAKGLKNDELAALARKLMEGGQD